MWWILVLFAAITLLISLALINVFIRVTRYPFYFTSILTLSIFLPLSIIFLLPIDLISSLNDEHSIFYIKNSLVLILWKCNYWITFLLTWLILPFLQSWYDNGQFNTRSRFISSVKEVLKFQIIILVFGVFGLIYIVSSIGFNFVAIKSLVITISHIYSLVLLLWLMSHSLITIPKNQYLDSVQSFKQLHDNYVKLPKLNEEMNDIKFNLKECCGKIMKLNDLKDYNVEYRDWIINLVDQVPQEYSDPLWYRGDPISNDQLNNSFMSKITKDFNYYSYRFNLIKAQFDDLIDKTILLEDIINSHDTKFLDFRFKPTRFSGKSNYIIYKYVIPALQKIFSLLLLALSIVIIESEILHSTRLSIINLIFTKQNLNVQTVKNFTILIVILTYMLLLALNSLSNIRIFNIYHLSRHQSSDPVSITFFITYAARLTIPLSYNFTMLLDNSNNSFHQFLGSSLTLIPIGNILNEWLPRLILLPLLLSFFNVYEKIKNFISSKFDFEFYDYFDDLEFESTDIDVDLLKRNSLIQQGQKLAQQEANKIASGDRLQRSQLRPFNIRRSMHTDMESFDLSSNYNSRISSDTFATDNIGDTSVLSKMSNLASTFWGKFRNSNRYDSDNTMMSDAMITQYDDLHDDENLII